MEQVTKLISRVVEENNLIYMVLSNYTGREKIEYSKVDVRPVEIKGVLNYQWTYHYEDKVLHENLEAREVGLKLLTLMGNGFRQIMIWTEEADYQILVSKKGKVKILKKKPTRSMGDISYDRKKEYILEEGKPYDFLVRLGVMNKDGKVYADMYDKFKQINRFLELVQDIADDIKKDGVLNIVDFGCGKSYLTFALYHYLVQVKNWDVNIMGLDLKEDVIGFCNTVAEDLRYEDLKFEHGDIVDYKGDLDVDLVITLHACDNATDAALVKAIGWNAKAILSVPCCQHEFRDLIDSDILRPMLKHGIIKEKLSSLVTDSLRGKVLELLGYRVQLLEFIDMEHTPKNILIRAVRGDARVDMKGYREYEEFKDFWGLKDIFIERELKKINIEI